MTWIPVSERLPEHVWHSAYYSKDVLAFDAGAEDGRDAIRVAYCRLPDGTWDWSFSGTFEEDDCPVNITHWQPLPKLPEGE